VLSSQIWFNVIQPYLKSTQVFVCPSATYQYASNCSYGWNYRGSQASNTALDGGDLQMWTISVSLAYFANTAGTILLGDDGWVTNTTADPDDWSEGAPGGTGVNQMYMRFSQAPYQGSYGAWNTDPWRPVPRHMGGANFTFIDGHAKWLLVETAIQGQRRSADCQWDNW
jgi:prepilin-type processing-associated H-X9-DG protein